ncbi:hypothetical protein [Nonlabens sp.]|uniref:DUF6973 domain-containing protein n=1 Tax=Nonlabens sp. TaxID=1888209 RepID=UPI001BCC28D5|nr:hypothetical protein [Nonlabens sp.]
MKNNFKNLLKLTTLLVGICLLAVSCENETVDIDNQTLIENGNNPFIKKGSIGDFQNINSYVSRLKNQSTLFKTGADANSNNFTVIENSDIYVYTDSTGTTTYTIPVRRENQVNFSFSNLIIKTVNDIEVNSFILNYSPTQEYLNEFVNDHQTPFEGAIEYEPLSLNDSSASRTSAKTGDCVETIILTFCSWPYDDPEDGYHVAGATCTPAYMWTETVFIDAGCSSSGGEGSSGTGTGSGTGGGAGDPTPTAPLPSDTCESSLGDTGITGSDECITSADDIERGNLIQSLGAQLLEAQINWINTTRNISLIYELNNFLEQGSYYDQNLYDELVVIAIDNHMNFTLSNYPGSANGLPFNWWNDEDFIINSGNFDIDDERPNGREVIVFAAYPAQAILHVENSNTALDRSWELVTNNTLTGIEDGKADAFRHAFWNALGTAEFGSRIMKYFADAHEWGETGLPVTMDFYNNHKGRVLRENYSFLTSEATISTAILQAVFNGSFKYINSSGILVPTNL